MSLLRAVPPRVRFALGGLLARASASVTSSSVSTSFASAMSSIGSSTSAPRRPALVAAQPRGLALGADRACRGSACGRRPRPSSRSGQCRHSARNPTPHQRPVDARRGNLEPIGAVDRVGDIEHRRQRARDLLAILHRHRAVRPLRHDLHGAAVERRTRARAPGDSRAAASTGSTIAATRAASPCSTISRGSLSSCSGGGAGRLVPRCAAIAVTKKSGPRGTHSQNPILVMRCTYGREI